MEQLGEKISKEIEDEVRPRASRSRWNSSGRRSARRWKRNSAPDFEKKMEAFGKEIEGKFGPGSEFAKKMEAFGKEMEAKFGPGSDFEKKMKSSAMR